VNPSTPKVVIMAVVIILGVFGLAALGAVTFLIADGTEASSIAILVGPMGVAIGAVAGVLASTRTTDTAAPTPSPALPNYTTTPIVAADHPAS